MRVTKKLVTLMAMAMSAFGLVGCVTAAAPRGETAPAIVPLVDPPAKPGLPTLLVAMPNAVDFADVRRSLVSEVQRDFNIVTLVVTPATTVSELADTVERIKPVCSILMNNATLNLYRQYEATPAGRTSPPAVVVMAAFVEETKSALKRATGIAYEVPGITAFVNLRTVVNAPVSRVGVIYRPAFQKFIARQERLAAKEHVQIIGVPVSGDVTVDSVREALRRLTDELKVDAVWMLNDNGLLRDSRFLEQTWRAVLADSKLPLIVGLPNLVDPMSPLGMLAVVPDHEALGLQTANLIFELADKGWRVEDHSVELPLSVRTVVDLKAVRASFGLRPDALRHIDVGRE